MRRTVWNGLEESVIEEEVNSAKGFRKKIEDE